ncbi:MAG: Endonuclease/exonuclease/phosphatase [Mycobacterium sp.]|nr:Endonuclease/exonuclease/phosphatase [Mycobacterium sp.]
MTTDTPRWRAALRQGITVLSWVIAVALLLLEVVRLAGWDIHSRWLIALSTAWPLVVIPGLLVVIGAAYVRRRLLGGIAVLVLFIVAAAWWPCWIGSADAGSKGGTHIRVLSLNVQYSNDTGAAASRQIKANNPDVVVLSELSPLTLRHLDLSQYPYSWQRPQTNAFGQGVYSRWPLTQESTWSVSGLAMARMTVATPAGPVRLYQVHTNAPQGSAARHIWSAQLAMLRHLINAERLPVVAAGDFNASHWDASYKDLLGGPRHMLDAGAGRGYLATWPSGRPWLPPVFALDHVLVSKGIGVRGFRVLGPMGSDHRGIVAELNMTAA